MSVTTDTCPLASCKQQSRPSVCVLPLGHSEQAAFIPSVNRQQQCESYSNQMPSLLPPTQLLTCTLMLPSAPKVRLHKSSEELAGCWKLSWTVRHPLMRLLSSMLQAVGGPKCAAAACNLRCVRRQQGVQQHVLKVVLSPGHMAAGCNIKIRSGHRKYLALSLPRGS